MQNNSSESQIFNYPAAKYTSNYDSEALRGINGPRPWNITEVIKDYSGINKTMLDIGCGTSFKTISLAPYFKKIVGIDISESMIKKSKDDITKHNIANMEIQYGDGNNLPFLESSFDLATAILSRWKIAEIYRVLKEDGIAIVESHGALDKYNIKAEFGQDEQGWLGQMMHYTHEEMIKLHYNLFEEFFSKVDITIGKWKTYYTLEGVIQLFENTPMIRNFNKDKDQNAIQSICSKYTTPHGIMTEQHRILIIARK